MEEGNAVLESGSVCLYVPEEMTFHDDVVRVDLKGFLWNTMLLVETARISRAGGTCSI